MIEIERIGLDRLADYNGVPMLTPIESRLAIRLIDGGLGGFQLVEEPVDRPWIKDHGALTDRVQRWDTSGWAFLLASVGGVATGGATVAARTPEVSMLDRRDDLALLWDLRVHPDHQRRGVGSALLGRMVEWSRAEGMTQLKIETQDVNVPACRFYAKQGCRLGRIDRHGYAGDPRVAHEAMLIWYLDLRQSGS